MPKKGQKTSKKGEGEAIQDEGQESPGKPLKNPQREYFCQLYVHPGNCFAHGTYSYMEAFNMEPWQYKSAASLACRLLKDPEILKRINELLDMGELNPQFVDKNLAFIIAQNSDLGAKMQGIKEYNRMQKRVSDRLEVEVLPPPTKIEIVSSGKRKDCGECGKASCKACQKRKARNASAA